MKIVKYDVDSSIDFTGTGKYGDIVKDCQKIINENNIENGGQLVVNYIFDVPFEWEYLVVAYEEDEIVGFSLIRKAYDEHGLKDTPEYNYISDIVVKNKYKGRGIGQELLKSSLDNNNGLPLVASVRKSNDVSLKFLSNYMKVYSAIDDWGGYYRLVDNDSFDNLYGESSERLVSSVKMK